MTRSNRTRYLDMKTSRIFGKNQFTTITRVAFVWIGRIRCPMYPKRHLTLLIRGLYIFRLIFRVLYGDERRGIAQEWFKN